MITPSSSELLRLCDLVPDLDPVEILPLLLENQLSWHLRYHAPLWQKILLPKYILLHLQQYPRYPDV